ncbi:MAG TPA: hypothetical protein VN828_05855 [Acidobacteriaceae bacterium]|nr:hypothetical protein [Acidobacteriaceae bacterium]
MNTSRHLMMARLVEADVLREEKCLRETGSYACTFLLNSWEEALLRTQADRSDKPLKDFLYMLWELLGRSIDCRPGRIER